MPIVQEDGEEPGFLWVQCPNCHEIKPLETHLGEAVGAGSGPGAKDSGRTPFRRTLKSHHPGEGPPATRAGETVRTYSPGEEYKPGDLIYHRQWNDTGTVVDKKESGGGRRMIVVEFEKMGKRKLVMETEQGK